MILKKSCLLIVSLVFFVAVLQAQETADALFQQARTRAFDHKDYPAAIALCRQALAQSPDYTDIRVFLGRLYFWNDQADSARTLLDAVATEHPDNEEVLQAAADIARYTGQYEQSLTYAKTGLHYHPASEGLWLAKAKALTELKQFKAASLVTDTLLNKYPQSTAARSLAMQLKDYRSLNKIGITYDYTHFQQQFADAWQLVSLDYTRQTNAGSFTARLNYGNRYGSSGWQWEVDGYPRLSNTFYAYLNLGYSNDLPVFPHYRAGFSLYANLPHSFEADAGFRYLNFDNDTWIYTGSIGKYYRNWWFNARAYITPDNARVSQSYALTTRYYGKDADTYFTALVGSGVSPDDRAQAAQLNSGYKLKTVKASAGYHLSVRSLNIFSVTAGWANVEYLPGTKDNQLNASISYQRRF